MIVPRYYENLHMLHENTMPNRAYYIPAGTQRDDLCENRENSDRFQLLNGSWKFKYFDSIYDLKEEFSERDTRREALMRFLCRDAGRISDMTDTSIPTHVIRSPWTRRMCLRKIPAEPMCIHSPMQRMKMRPKLT